MENEKINNLRRIMGTLPEEESKFETPFYMGVKDIEVKMIDWPSNIYKPLVTLATSCWGNKIDKWEDLGIKGRFFVVKAVLERVALPLAYESVSFTFAVENVSRWCFDQIARARIGAVFSSMGTRDNYHANMGFRIADEIYQDKNLLNDYMKLAIKCKKMYKRIVEKGKGSWQTARDIIPISNIHRFSMSMNLAALMNFCSNRMKFCEASQTVAVAWLIREEMKKKFPLIAHYLRPGCDFSKKCQYHKKYSLSEAFGCLFKECGRNECEASDKYSTFNNSCSDKKTIEKQLNVKIPDSNYWDTINVNDFVKKGTIDRKYFEED